MKFKNSYVLLIAMAIFLLVSIGSVCASDDNTTDSAVELVDDGTDIVLADEEVDSPLANESGSETVDEKATTTIETDKDTYKYGYDADKNISVSVKDNESKTITVNESDFTVLEENNTINFEYNNSIISIKDKLSVGSHNLTINYLGNLNYNSSSKLILLQIFGNNTITAPETVVSDGSSIEIPITINDGVDNITIVKDELGLTLTYTNETGNVTQIPINDFQLEDGKIILTITDIKLIAASLTINYTDAVEPKTVGIRLATKVSAEDAKIKTDEDKNITVNVLDSQDIGLNISKSDLKVLVNGNEVTFDYNNSTITLGSLDIGIYNLTVQYLGNETYNASSKEIILSIYGNNTINVPDYVVSDDGKSLEIPVTISNGIENITLVKDDFKITLTYTNETGNVTSKNITDFNLNDGKIIISFDSKLDSVTIDYVNSTGAKTVKVNLAASIAAVPDETKYRFNETNNITVKVSDASGNVLNITQDDLKVFDNGNEIAFNFNNSIITVELEEGVHNLTVTYKGNETFNATSTTIELKVYGDIKFNPDASVILNDTKQITIAINLNDGADYVTIDESKLNVTLFYTVGNETYNKTVTYTLNNQSITFQVSDAFESAYVNIKYAENNLTANTTIKVATELNAADDVQFGESEVKNITIEFKAANGYDINLTQDNFQVLSNGKSTNFTYSNSTFTLTGAFKAGIYNITIKYIGDDTFIESLKDLTLTIYSVNATSSTNINSTKKGEVKVDVTNGNETVNITASDLNVTASYKDGNDTVNIGVTVTKFENGTLSFTLDSGDFKTATLTIRYNNTEFNVTLNRIYNIKIVPVSVSADYQDGSFTFKVVDVDNNNAPLANKTVSVSLAQNQTTIWFVTKTSSGSYNLGTSKTLTTDKNGIATLENKGFYPGLVTSDELYCPVGEYTMTVTGSGDLKGTNKTTITINKVSVNIKLSSFSEYYGTSKKIKITVTNANTGKTLSGVYVLLEINGASLSTPRQQTNSKGLIELGVSGLPVGTYKMKFYANDTNLKSKSSSGSFTIKGIPVKISASIGTVYYNTGNTATIKVTKNGKAMKGTYVYVKVAITSSKTKTYAIKTNSKGKITLKTGVNIDLLAVGKHKITVSIADTKKYSGSVTKTLTVKKAPAKISAKKVTDYYKGVKTLKVKVINTKNKKAIRYAKVKVNNAAYYTGSNGVLSLGLGTLKPGTYKATVKGASTKNYSAKKVTTTIKIKKAPTKLTAKKFKAKKGAKKYFKVKVTNKKTKKVIGGVKVKIKVYTGKKAKTYTAKTNSKGIAKLSTKSLKVGSHKVVVSSANKYCVAKKVKSVIKIKK